MAVDNKIDGMPELFRGLREFAEGAGDLRRSERDLFARFGDTERGWLGSEGRGSFAPLSPAYARRKQQRHGPRPILQASGELFRALTDAPAFEVGAGGTEMTIRPGGPRARRVAAVHARGRRGMPARPPLAPARDFMNLGDVIEKNAVTFARALGFRAK
jgi:hypothetical protein